MTRKIIWILVSSLMVSSLVLASCGPAVPEEEEEEVIVPAEEEEEVIVPAEGEEEEVVPVAEGPKYGGTITVCSSLSLASPNPAQGTPGIQYLDSYAHDKLGVGDWSRGPAGTGELGFTSPTYFYPYVGALAESWEQTDPYTFIIHIRQGVHFHNKPPVSGREMTADDVVYSINYLLAHPELMSPVNPAQRESITALDKYTVELKSNTLDTRFLEPYMLGESTWIRPPEMEETYGEGFTDIEGVCGTGPFVLTDFVSSSAANFERNPDYWGYDELNPENRLPYADKVKFLMITDKSTYLSALRTGKIDLQRTIYINDAESLIQTNPEMEYVHYLAYNFEKVSMRQDLEELPFSDVRVRKALSMAIDREAIIKDYLKGQGEILAFPLHPESKDFYIPLEELPESAREQFEYNPEKARQLLANAGYPDGFETECITMQPAVEKLQILVAYWKTIGVDCEIKVLDMGAWLNLNFGKQYPQMSCGSSSSRTPVYTLEETTSNAFFNCDMHFDPEYDAKVVKLTETSDEAEKKQLIQELTISWLDGANSILFPAEYQYNFWQPWLKNHHGETMLGRDNEGALIARLWVDQELKEKMGY